MGRTDDFIFDAMSKATNLRVHNLTADDETVTYRMHLDLVLPRAEYESLASSASSRGNRVATLVAKLARKGLTNFFAADSDDSTAASSSRATTTSDAASLPASIKVRELIHG